MIKVASANPGRFRRWSAAIAAWMQSLGVRNNLDDATCSDLRDQAWRFCVRGEGEKGVTALQDLRGRLEARRPTVQRDQQLAATFGMLATVYRQLGRTEVALAAAERELTLHQVLGQNREAANALGMIAELLTQQRRYGDAEARYADAFYAALTAADYGLQAIIMEKQGLLKRRQEFHLQAVLLFREALTLFQRQVDKEEEMRLWDILATTEVQQGDLDAAELSYARSLELAKHLDAREQLAINAQNVGILYQKRAEKAMDVETQVALLQEAIRSIEKSLAIKLEMDNTVGTEASYFQLGILYWKLGEPEQAEKYLLQATNLSETLKLSKVYKNYSVLARFAQSRGDWEGAAQWQARCDAKVAELHQRT
ncbi:MAG: tetratricopeptide repeat protein [Gammaproteobacteria bacterium]|nr:tetratricopeptide repeat protein [Gammaproteobacteria bacterium]MCP5424354.1 tetratricopeptide repeat protein [Gammaproteobacteria bacterium]MCP5459105.1 tetratricopeptide repeat protein [Gammaproteobacteria bacterium]